MEGRLTLKRGRGISKVERAELVALRTGLPEFCFLEIWTFTPGKRTPAIEVL